MFSKPIVSLGPIDIFHDLSVTIYCPVKNKVFHVDVSILDENKHIGFRIDARLLKEKRKDNLVKKLFDYCKNNLELGEDYEAIIIKQGIHTDQSVLNTDRHSVLKHFVKHFKPRKVIDYLSEPTHNELHSFNAFYNSGFTEAMCLSWDCGGDATAFSLHGFKNKIQNYAQDFPFEASWAYVWVGHRVIPFKSIPQETAILRWHSYRIDCPGKMMGHSGFYKIKYPDYDKEKYIELVNKIKRSMSSYLELIEYLKTEYETPIKILTDPDFIQKNEEIYALKSEHDQMLYSAAAQEAFEEFIIDFFYKDDLYKKIKTYYGNNLCMSGGSSLNVLANEKIRKEFGFNIFVSPNSTDGGLSEGLLYHYAESMGKEIPRLGSRTNCPLVDEDNIPPPNKILNQEEFCSLLKNGKIIGFLQGDVENGPRALGRRSILCDPRYPDMKNKINRNVKNREWFRPFAPVCKLEDAPIYFDRDRFDDLEFMSFAVNVKEEYKEILSSVTHIDGTARLQTVTKKQNPVLYEILDTFDGVLLNTSFNVSGKPILNTFKTAMEVLNETELDYVVFHKDNQYNLYEKNVAI